ncbi:hypothetical protein ACS0TY_032492 [Phlomoides rotata]
MGRTGSENGKRKRVNVIPTAVASSSAPPPKWIDLPADITANILHRLGAIEILERVQLVCTTWRRVCQDPAMWRVIHVRDAEFDYDDYELCRVAVDRSQGQLIEISLDEIGDDELLNYIVDRSIHLKRLTLHQIDFVTGKDLVKDVKKLPHLEELHLTYMPSVKAEDIEAIGISCPMLKSFTFNESGFQCPVETFVSDNEELKYGNDSNRHARAIAKTMPNLRHLSLICNTIKNNGLEAILDGCPHLESLDLRLCFHIDLQADVGKRCYEQIKRVKGTFDSVSDIKWLDEDSEEIAFLGNPGYSGWYDLSESDDSDYDPFWW